MNREHSTKGYKVVSNGDAVNVKFYGLTVIADATITAVTAPTTAPDDEITAYSADTSGIATQVLPAGVYYPIRGSAIQLSAGKVICWLE